MCMSEIPEIPNIDAINWARQYGDEIIIRVYGEHYKGASVLIAQAYLKGWTYPELVKAIESNYSCPPDIAKTIASTEMTRAHTNAELMMEQRYFEMFGEHLVPIWKTCNDEHVCDFCRPRREQPITDDIYPPAHPGCRCMLSYISEGYLTPEQQEKWNNRPR